MSYTTNRQPQGVIKNLETFLREGLISEIVAINDYSHFINSTDNKEVKDIFHHIMEEEKEHYGLFLAALRCVDHEHKELEAEVKEHVHITTKGIYRDYSNKKSKSNLLALIREAIKAELEAIILYEHFINNINANDNISMLKLIRDITRDEKEHVEELTKVLTILDKDKYGPIN